MRQPPGTRMSRRPPGGVRPRAETTLNVPLLVGLAGVVLLLLLWVLLLPPFSLLRGGSGWQRAGADSLVREKSDAPKPPDGYQLASPYFEIRFTQGGGAGPAMMTVPLSEGGAGRGLALYTWSGNEWKRLGPAEAAPDGRSARGQVDQIPNNVAVMRRSGGGLQIQAVLPQGATLHPDAANVITTQSPADFTPAADGTVRGNAPARPQGGDVTLVPVVRATSGAEAQAVNQILGSDQTRAAHVTALVQLVQTDKLDGIDLEYTALEPSLGSSFTALVTALAGELHKSGQTLTVTLPLPRREGNNWNTFGYDWKAIGGAADFVRIAPERDQSIYRRAMREALNYITGQVDAKKVILTVSPLAEEKSDQGIRTMTALEALSIASQIALPEPDKIATGAEVDVRAQNLTRGENSNAGLLWDATAAAVSFVYQSGDALRTVWIENQFSTAFKLEFVQLWGLGGVAVDDASNAPGMANIWPAITQLKNGQLTLLQPNSGLLKPQWLVDGTSAEVGKAVFAWKPAETGNHTIALVVGDGVMRVVNSRQVTVRAGTAPISTATRSPSPTVTGR